jgi:hypothetical protein
VITVAGGGKNPVFSSRRKRTARGRKEASKTCERKRRRQRGMGIKAAVAWDEGGGRRKAAVGRR